MPAPIEDDPFAGADAERFTGTNGTDGSLRFTAKTTPRFTLSGPEFEQFRSAGAGSQSQLRGWGGVLIASLP